MKKINEILSPVRQRLIEFNDYFDDMISSDKDVPKEFAEYIIDNKGKQVRPALVLLAAEVCGGVTERSYAAAAIVELMHNAALMHDDVIDNSDFRRGNPSFKALWGNNYSILFGDFIISKIFTHIAERREYEFFEIAANVFRNMCLSEINQMDRIRDLETDEDMYFDIIGGKTAGLIFAACEMGAISAAYSRGQRNLIKQFGKYLGLAFQIKDDVFDYGFDSKTGKTSHKDIMEKKLTLPMIHSLEQSDAASSFNIKNYIKNGDLNKENIAEIIDFVNSHGGINYSIDVASGYIDRALRILAEFPESEARNSMTALAKFIVDRDY